MQLKAYAVLVSLAVLGIVSATGVLVTGVRAATAAPAGAEEWCGFHDKTGSRVRCGYTSQSGCKQKVAGKDPVCMPNPDFAMRSHDGAPDEG